MAVDFFHRVIVTGPPTRMVAFRDAMVRTNIRHIGKDTWPEDVSFSFQALYDIAPSVRKVEPLPPGRSL
jgi:hypothetical protein